MRITITANDLKKPKIINGVDADVQDLKILYKNLTERKDFIKEIVITETEIHITTKP